MNDIARTILEALDERRQIAPISDHEPQFDLDAAYLASDAITAIRVARGQTPVGWKIGFTNRTIWSEYDVHAPIWGPMYDATVHPWNVEQGPARLDVERFVEPRIEPEIVFRIARLPHSGMDDRELLSCIEAVAHGFEIVQSVFPGWRFRAPDTVAAFALHGALVHGPFVAIDASQADRWLETLSAFQIHLYRDGERIDHGAAVNVLDGPLHALRHFIAGLEVRPMARGIEPGDLVTTGTLTRAFPVAAGEIWSTRLTGLALPGMRLRLDGGTATLERLVAKAAEARFRVEHPESCADPDAYEQAVATGIAAETAIARLLYRAPPRLKDARRTVDERAQMLAREWKNRPTP